MIVRFRRPASSASQCYLKAVSFTKSNLDIKFVVNLFACILLHICSVVFQVPNGHDTVFFENRTPAHKNILVIKF